MSALASIRCPLLRELPENNPATTITVNMVWHSRVHQDPAQRWLRELISSTVSDVIPSVNLARIARD
jgi:DNA-binding transcriptional LysR family regulator